MHKSPKGLVFLFRVGSSKVARNAYCWNGKSEAYGMLNFESAHLWVYRLS